MLRNQHGKLKKPMRREKDEKQREKVSMLKVKIGITRTEDGKVLLEIVQMMEKGLNARVKRGTRYQNANTRRKNKNYG